MDLLIGSQIIVEVKATQSLLPAHRAQMLTYLKLSKKRVGLPITFNVVHLKEGIERLIL